MTLVHHVLARECKWKDTSLLAPCEPWSSFRLDKSRAKVLFDVYQTIHLTFHKGMVGGKEGEGGGWGVVGRFRKRRKSEVHVVGQVFD